MLGFVQNEICIRRTFHIVFQNDNPLATVTFNPDHLTMTRKKKQKKTIRKQATTATNFISESTEVKRL